MYDIIFRNAKIVDGTGSVPYISDLAVKDGIIAEIGDLSAASAAREVDAAGKYLTPGFIDMHSHTDIIAPFYPDMDSALYQGITTSFTGHCGLGIAPVPKYWLEMCFDDPAYRRAMPSLAPFRPGFTSAVETSVMAEAVKEVFGAELDWTSFGSLMDRLDRHGMGHDLAMACGLAQLRTNAMNNDYRREATEEEICAMEEMLKEAFEAGAPALSFGLDYSPDCYASETELLRLASLAAKYGRVLTAHCQSMDFRRGEKKPFAAIDGFKEICEIALKTGVHAHISHIDLGFSVEPFNEALIKASCEATLAEIEEYRKKGANVTWDVLAPAKTMIFYQAKLYKRLIKYVRAAGSPEKFLRMLNSTAYCKQLKKEAEDGLLPLNAAAARLKVSASSDGELPGNTLGELSQKWGMDIYDTVFEVLRRDFHTSVYMPSARRNNWERFYDDPDASIGLDFMMLNADLPERWDNQFDWLNPDSFTGMLQYLCARKHKPIEFTVRQITGAAAEKIGLKDRGLLKTGMRADMVLVDIENLEPNIDYAEPAKASKGMEMVLIKGKVAFENGKAIRVRAGRTVRV